MTTGQRIRNARKKLGLTQSELAKRLEVPFQSISQWERDIRNPKIETLQRIADALKIPISTFLTSDEAEEVEAIIDTIRPREDDETKLELYRQGLAEEAIASRPILAATVARDIADSAILKAFADVSDEDIREWSIDMMDHMNRLGNIEVLQLLEALSEVSRYKIQTEKSPADGD